MRTITRALLGWLFPPTGQRRAEEPPAEPPTLPTPRQLVYTNRAVLPEIIDGDASPLVRPYIVHWEQEQRRRALEAALDGIDLGPEVIHGVKLSGAA